MTPTEDICARLDERGIKYKKMGLQIEVVSNGLLWHIAFTGLGDFEGLHANCITPMTPEQAIAATVGNAQEPTNAVIERIGRFCTDYAQCLVDATLHDKRPFDAVDHRTCESMEAVEDKLIRELAEDIAKVGVGTCHLEECEHEREIPYDLPDCDGGWYTEVTHDCDECGYENIDPNISFCGGCGRRVVSE